MILYAEGIFEWELGVIHDFVCDDILNDTDPLVECKGLFKWLNFLWNEVRSIRHPIYNCKDQRGLNNIKSEYFLSQDSEVFQKRPVMPQQETTVRNSNNQSHAKLVKGEELHTDN